MYTQSLQLCLQYIRFDKGLVGAILVASFLLQIFLSQLESLILFQNSELLIPLKLLFSIIHIWMFLLLLRKLKAHFEGNKILFQEAAAEALTSTPSFILYSILYIFMVIAGFFLLLIPGFYFLGACYFIPYFAALDIETEGTSIEDSRKLSHQHFPFVWFLSFFSLVTDLGLEMKDLYTQAISPYLMGSLTFFTIILSMIFFLWGGSFTLEQKVKKNLFE